MKLSNALLSTWKPRSRSALTAALPLRFRDLKIRPKLIVLHNLFFLMLTCGVYFTLIPSLEKRVATARTIEISLITEIFSSGRLPLQLPRIGSYDYKEGPADHLSLPHELQQWLDSNPGQVTTRADYLYRKDPATGLYRRITLPNTVYDEVVERAKLTLFLVLGLIYVLAVVLLESVIMPRYVYQPITHMLLADEATRRGDRERELIPEARIPADEIGQIMRSRNETVSELRRQEDHLAQAISHLEAQDRLASLGQLSASVAHEMNTPLAVLHGSIEKLIETVPNQQSQERLQRMLRVTQRLRKISEGLVDFARVRRETMDTIHLRPLIDEAWSLVAIDERAAALSFRNEVPDAIAVVGNADRLIQVFVNLLQNSLQALGTEGALSIRSNRFLRDSRPWICIGFEDDGPGIPAAVLPNIFDAFVSSRLDSRGTGLGLTVAQGIVNQHGGTIHAGNRPNGGARLEVILPSAA